MSRNLIRFSIPLIGSAALAFAFLGCSDDDKPGATGTGGETGAGGGSSGSSSSGGKGGASGGASTGGKPASGGASAEAGADPYVCINADPADPGGAGKKDDACCSGLGKCVDPTSITDPKMKAALGHDSCGDTLKCQPPAATTADAGGVYEKCTAKLGGDLEGRCLPKCFLLGNPQVNQLAQETCGANMLCAPCYNPMDATDTGACTQKPGDAPVAAAPTAYATCGAFEGGAPAGICVPKVLVDASGNAAAPSLKQDDCAVATDRCVPALKAANTAACFSKCSTGIGGTLGAQYEPGACVPTYIVFDVAGANGLAILKKGSCTGDGELCAPCADPLNMGKPSHSCE